MPANYTAQPYHSASRATALPGSLYPAVPGQLQVRRHALAQSCQGAFLGLDVHLISCLCSASRPLRHGFAQGSSADEAGEPSTLGSGPAGSSYAPADWRAAAWEQFPGQAQAPGGSWVGALKQQAAAGVAALAAWGALPRWAAERALGHLQPGVPLSGMVAGCVCVCSAKVQYAVQC